MLSGTETLNLNLNLKIYCVKTPKQDTYMRTSGTPAESSFLIARGASMLSYLTLFGSITFRRLNCSASFS